MMYGWICPKCGKVWSPFQNECMNCNKVTCTANNSEDLGLHYDEDPRL